MKTEGIGGSNPDPSSWESDSLIPGLSPSVAPQAHRVGPPHGNIGALRTAERRGL